ncbi:MAG: poly(3-hydroxyalkanoate) synthetase [Deltaproteobacteria bacterium HGW-Deltaproteobacteria-12]|jgi:pimeloyl-ACP methyl ester carboxylesterase|nr:MAG: poly(3-hydroxyalkanoate) synthetase [Deltaproteobacteria bacterium HGW-Deltaproteobacteria-12]
MDKLLNTQQAKSWGEWQSHTREYLIDSLQRSIIYTDILRKRGNNYIKHIRSGQPPVLVYNYEMILNAKNFPRPANYALVRIRDRRKADEPPDHNKRRRESKLPPPIPKRPIVIMDPRAGHGPGIGGSKRDSEIGMALNNGHPVYFILFYSEPIPGQNLADVETAMATFMEKIVELHPYADAPAVMGNCQAGWAAALLCAERPDVTGPLILNGAPLSYWSGVVGENPMRYKGGLGGGVWVTSFLSDLGNGVFDGANLVANFEGLNPANTLWSKRYNVYSQVDTEEERYLAFEKWWGGFFMLTTDEIHFIVNNLFVGNKLERGELELREGEKISLKNIKNPILVFASLGDNITPAQQALNWIPRVYTSVDDIKRHGQVIIYIIHKDIGHLGIFVAGSVAKKEHHQIIANFDMIDFITPGLYEMIIEGDVAGGNFTTRYAERTFADIAAYDDGVEDEEDFSIVAKISEINDNIYQVLVRPWVKLWTTELSAEIIRNLHPLRVQRYMYADINPLMRPLKNLASVTRAQRKPASPDNPLVAMEKDVSEYIENVLNIYRDYRDLSQEQLFRFIYSRDLIRTFFPPTKDEAPRESDHYERADYDKRTQSLEEGGVAEGLIRVFMAVARTSRGIKRSHFDFAQEIAATHKVLGKIRPVQFKKILKEQAAILQADQDRAISALHILIKNKDDRMDALGIARRLCLVDGKYTREEEILIEKLKKGLKLKND